MINKEFIKYWAQGEKFSLEIAHVYGYLCGDETDNKKELKKYKKLQPKILKLAEINNKIIKSLEENNKITKKNERKVFKNLCPDCWRDKEKCDCI